MLVLNKWWEVGGGLSKIGGFGGRWTLKMVVSGRLAIKKTFGTEVE